MGEPFTRPYQVAYFDTDRRGQLMPQGVLLLFQELAILHSESIGAGMQWLNQNRRGWAITNWHIRFYETPKYYQKLTMTTWAHKMRKMQAHRNYDIKDATGKVLCEAMSLWIYMDLESRGPSVIPIDMAEQFLSDRQPPFEKEKFLFPKVAEGALVSSHRFTVKRGDTDTNGHANNVRYVEWALDDIPDELFANGTLTDMQVIYRKECYRNSPILSKAYLAETGDGQKKLSVHLLDGEDEETILAQVQFLYNNC